jgi:hypothetical protein
MECVLPKRYGARELVAMYDDRTDADTHLKGSAEGKRAA